jgi:hypothetical protein
MPWTFRTPPFLLSLLLSLAACDKQDSDTESGGNENAEDGNGDGDGDGTTTANEQDMGTPVLTWYSTCGDPSCSGYTGPYPGVPMCPDINEGDPCDVAEATCDFTSDCNAVMVCATEDPKQQAGGCPISRAAFKQDIHYTDASELSGYYQDVLELRLATWRYRDRHDDKQSLGVILEDGESEVSGPEGRVKIWADPANDRVDTYSYGSLAIVGVQVQAAELADMRAQMAALQRELTELRQRCK